VSKPDSRKNRNEISFLRTLARQVRRGPSFFKDTGRLDSYHSHQPDVAGRLGQHFSSRSWFSEERLQNNYVHW